MDLIHVRIFQNGVYLLKRFMERVGSTTIMVRTVERVLRIEDV